MFNPDFYLTAAGDMRGDLAIPRACRVVDRVADSAVGHDHLLIEVSPPVIGQKYGLGAEDISVLLIAQHFEGFPIDPILQWPCPVYIYRIVDRSLIETLTVTAATQSEMIGWGTLYKTRAEADDVYKKEGG